MRGVVGIAASAWQGRTGSKGGGSASAELLDCLEQLAADSKAGHSDALEI